MTDPADTPRRIRERFLADWLAPWAVGPGDHGGRKHPEPTGDHPYRDAFQRDRERVLHCTAFRRLDFKTQVFAPHQADHLRTRMTHTLEVAQVARALGRALRLNEDLIEAVALAHDLGHPPFGHGGEQALDELMANHGGFEHNRQSLRIVDYLEHPYPGPRGLNLTRTTRECLAKHRTKYPQPVCEDFADDLHPPLEGQLVDLADEIAYTSADLEDALHSQRVDRSELTGLTVWEQAWEHVRDLWPDAREIHLEIRAVKQVLSILADDIVTTSARLVERARPESVQDVREAGVFLASVSAEMAGPWKQLRAFLHERVYRSDANVQAERASQRILRELFGAFVDDPSRLPLRYQRRVDQDGLHRTVCDYVAGMTDRFCRNEHARILNR